MGADYIGWRGCALQEALGVDGFLGKLKLRSYRRVVEERIPLEQREAVRVTIAVTGRGSREVDYPTILRELGEFERGIPECRDCPLSGGAQLGCYRYVTYPVDAISERLLFEYFIAGVDEHDSLPNQLWRDIVSRVGEDTAWHDQRGPEGAFAEAPEVLEARFEYAGARHRVDSAQLLASLFISLQEPPVLVAYALFFDGFRAYVRERVGLRDDGSLELRVDGTDDPSEDELARRSQAALEQVQRVASARTFRELEDLVPMLLQAATRSLEDGWTVVVDG